MDLRLHEAAAAGDVAAIGDALRDGIPVDARDDRGRTPLLVATWADQPAAVRVLLDAGADVDLQDDQRDNPFLVAGAEGRLAILPLLTDAGADPAITNRYGGIALIPASERGHVDTVRTLIDAGVDVDHVNKLGWTALLEAVILGDGGQRHQQIVELLVKARANVDLGDREGVTPLRHARARGYREIEKILLAAGAR